MRHFAFIVLCTLLFSQFVFGQSRSWHNKNYVNINAGLGMFPTFLKDAGKAKVIPLYLAADYRFAKNFSMGAFIGHSVTETDLEEMPNGQLAQWKNSFLNIGIRAAAQSRDLNGWNIYGGMATGYSHSDIDITKGDEKSVREFRSLPPQRGKMLLTGFLGARYGFTRHVGMFSELGMGVSIAKVGISIRY